MSSTLRAATGKWESYFCEVIINENTNNYTASDKTVNDIILL